MLRLKDVSKYYYNKGIITSGFSRVNLELNIGEFVAITGESGSGKSTLLNVISGLDSYEEGEMYINGKETSHYSLNDFEDYRKKYIANIFQTFNLVNSYTVYQNIELILLVNGIKKDKEKAYILDLIEKVGLAKYKNTKVSKLSGGQKQRVAIARALAKDTPIIVADEPTGNLDKKSSESIIALLSEISKNKLVIIVTHNYEQIDAYVTRKIVMHDGKIVEDKNLKKGVKETINDGNNYDNITLINKIRLGIRNTFNVIPKFILLLLVYLFLISSIVLIYDLRKMDKYEKNHTGENYFFIDTSSKRIVLKKNDKTKFTINDYNNIKNIPNIDYIVKEDICLDQISYIFKDTYYYDFDGTVESVNNINKVDAGRLPISDYEIILKINPTYQYDIEGKLNQEYNIGEDVLIKDYKVKIVGLIYDYETYARTSFYVKDKLLKDLKTIAYQTKNELLVKLNNEIIDVSNNNAIYPTNLVKSGEVYINGGLNYLCKNYNCLNNHLSISASNLYTTNKLDLKVTNLFTENNFKNILKNIEYSKYSQSIFINIDDYYELFNNDDYQISVFIKDENKVRDTINSLNNLNIKSLYISDTLVDSDYNSVISDIIIFIMLLILVAVIFFVCYFVIKIILKSRNVYYSTLRILGSSKEVIKSIIDIELFNIATISYIIILCLLKLIGNIKNYQLFISLLKVSDFIILYLIIILLSFIIARKYAKSMFKTTAMNTIRESV